MYMPRHFEETRPEVLHALVRAHPLGLLITLDTAGAPVANPIPFMLEVDPAGLVGSATLVGHVARANPVWREGAERPALVVFQGADGYVSPGFYPSKQETGKVVPTWNYIAVEARGPLRVLEGSAAAHALVSRLTRRHEEGRSKPWAVDDAPSDYVETMLSAIAVIEIPLQSLVGKYKLSQNRSAADRGGVIGGLQADAAPPGSGALAAAMVAHGGPAA
jgi:transcriptional regulator